MSATKAQHHDTIEAARRSDYNPRKIQDLRAEARRIQERLMALYTESLDTIDRYLYGLPITRLDSDIRKEVADLNEQLDLIISEFNDRRRI